jgi:outer membrane protein OmpA-like peptidoglycan-associated protein
MRAPLRAAARVALLSISAAAWGLPQAIAAQDGAQLSRRHGRDVETDTLDGRDADRGLVLTVGDVAFDPGQSSLKASALTTVERLVQFMGDYPERSVRIEGHTDSAGDDATNLRLSERRAQAVRDALLERGIDAARITTIGYGEARPIASNDTPDGRQRNRRIEIVVSDEQGTFGDEARAGVE